MKKSDIGSRLYSASGLLLILVISTPVMAIDGAIDGKKLYRENCLTCHGENGKGGVGVPLGLKSFQETVSNRYLFRTIRYGRPGRVMPAFKHFSDAQIYALVKTIRSFAKVRPRKFSLAKIRGNARRGRELYKKRCASCHGARGEGGKGTGVTYSRPRDLPIIAPALNNSGFLKSASDRMIRYTLEKGRKGTPMSSFLKAGMSRKDINNVIAYIRSFERKPITPRDVSNEPSFLKVKSNYSLKDTLANPKRAVKGANYRLIRIQYLNQGLVAKGKEDKKVIIVYFCNFKQLNDALAIDPRVGLFLPCRLTLVENRNGVFIYGVNPSKLAGLFNNNELNKVCAQMKKTYEGIIEEATL